MIDILGDQVERIVTLMDVTKADGLLAHKGGMEM
jgi:hypothetical protein